MNLRMMAAFTIGCTGVLLSGAAIVSGRLVDKGKEAVIGANVRLLTLPDSTFQGASPTDWDGKFQFDSVPVGKYTLAIDAFGMQSDPTSLEVKNPSQELTLPEIILKEKSTMLDNVTVVGRQPSIVTKQDTIEYNASSFKTSTNANVEELLKKLPGVEVGSDGSIQSNGKSVTKILVDGEEFFSDDPKMASKNLRSDMIDKVQVLDRKSDMARLTGIDNGEEETVINLTIKKGMKKGWFGNVKAGYGTDSRYTFGFMVNRFTGNNQFTFLGSMNNVNELNFTDMGRGRFRDFGGGNDGITNSQSLGMNFAVGSSDKLRVGGNILYTHSDQDYRRRSSTQYLFPDSVSYQNSWSEAKNKGHNVRADLRLQWKIDDNNTIDFRPRFSYNNRLSEKMDTTLLRAGDPKMSRVNRQDNFQNNKGNSYETSGQLIYSHTFPQRQGRQFSVTGNYSFSDTRQKGLSLSDITYYLMQDDNQELFRLIDNHQWSNNVSGSLNWVEPIGDLDRGNFLTFTYRANYRFNNADKYTYDLPYLFEDGITFEAFRALAMAQDGGELNETLSNRFRNDFFSQELQVGYKKVKDKINMEVGMLFSPSMSKSEDLINPLRNIKTRWVWNIAPYMRFRYNFNKTKNLSINYRARTNQPSMNQLQPVADTSDPLHITVGNPNLKPTFTQNVMLRFSNYNAETQQSLMAMAFVNHSLNSIVSKTTSIYKPDPTTGKEIPTGGQTTTYTNVDNVFSVMGGAMFNQPLGKAHWRLNANFFANYNSAPGYINGNFNRSGNLSLRPSVGVTFTNDIFQMTVRPTYALQYTHNTLPMQPNRTVHTYGANADAHLYLPFGLEFSTDVDYSKNTGYASGYNQKQWLWNAEVSYSFLKSRSLTLACKVYDILQQRSNISRNVSATSISDTWTNSLTRYLMVTLTWNFQSFGSNKQGDMPMMGPGGMPGPPPGGGGRPPMGPPPGGPGRF